MWNETREHNAHLIAEGLQEPNSIDLQDRVDCSRLCL